jgi:hypothetical protein
MSQENKTVVEINGVKLEIDMRYAKRVDEFKIGDNIKVLIKDYGDSYTSYPGVIVGFDQFEKRPTIVICYFKEAYNDPSIKFCYLNSESKDIEICHMGDHEKTLDRQRVVDHLDTKLMKAEQELDDLKRRKNYFLEQYNSHFKL